MTEKEMSRAVLAINASYLLLGADTVGFLDLLSDKDQERFKKAQEKIAYGMLKKAGFDGPVSYDEILARLEKDKQV